VLGEAGQVLSMSYAPLVSPLAPKSCDGLELPSEDTEFTSKISWDTATPGMSLRVVLAGEKPPPGLQFLPYKRSPNQAIANIANPLLNEGSNNGQQPPPSGPLGFLSKYWYLVLAMLVINLLGATSEQSEPPHDRRARSAGESLQQGSPSAKTRSADDASVAASARGAALASPAGAGGPSAPSDANLNRQRRGKRG
jgi:hypothetical protein